MGTTLAADPPREAAVPEDRLSVTDNVSIAMNCLLQRHRGGWMQLTVQDDSRFTVTLAAGVRYEPVCREPI